MALDQCVFPQVPGAARREIVTVVVPQPAGRASIERTFSVERYMVNISNAFALKLY